MRDARIEKVVIGVCIHQRGRQLQYADYIFPVKPSTDPCAGLQGGNPIGFRRHSSPRIKTTTRIMEAEVAWRARERIVRTLVTTRLV